MDTIKKRADFLTAAKGRKWAAPGAVVQMVKQPRNGEDTQALATPRVGYTVTKKVGNAVIRNRVKRRLRAAVAEVFPGQARPGYDYVVIGRAQTIGRSYECLLDDLRTALIKLHTPSRRRSHEAKKRSRDRG